MFDFGFPPGNVSPIGAAVVGAGELHQLMEEFNRTYSPAQREIIAAQAAKVVYGMMSNRDPFAQLFDLGVLAILLSQPGGAGQDFQRAIEQQLAIMRR